MRNALIAEKICSVDSSDSKRIQNPYGSQPTATIQAVAGTYSVTAWTITDDALTVTDEVIYAEHVFAHEDYFGVFDVATSRIDNMMYAVAFGIDKFVNTLKANSKSFLIDLEALFMGATGGKQGLMSCAA